ncbi:DegV family protein [Priestia flexa]|uniref:DegV family protein n=1 Tax=Priestia flexa TaxID=86664 RepID=UPI0030B9F350
MFFKEFSLKYEAVIHVSLSSKFSSSFHNATLAAKKYKNVYVIDSLNLSGGSGIAVYEVALMAKKGIEPNEICFNMEGLVKSINGSFVIDCLDYLYKGGRCSGLESISATLLKIKPTIEISNGRMVVGKKYRGSFERCLVKYVEDRLLSNHNIDISRIFITHPSCEKQTIAKVKEIIRYYVKFDEIIVSNTSCTVSSHCGPNTLGIFFKYKN